MTLLEVLLALVIGAALLTTMAFATYTFAQVWLTGAGDDGFDQHVDGVSTFLTQALLSAEADGEDNALPVQWARPPGWSDSDDPLLFFRQAAPPPLLAQPERELPAVNLYLHWDRDAGLSLLWYSELEETVEDLDDLYRTPLSPFVSAVAFAYYDADDEVWEIEDEPEEDGDGAYLLPDFLQLTFTHADHDPQIRSVYIPQRSEALPIF